MEPMTLESAVEVFAQGFAFTRSYTHPYVVEVKHGLTIMHDTPGRYDGERNPEYIVLRMTPEKGVKALRKAGCVRGGVCVIEDNDADLAETKDAYKKHGLRLFRREPFFAARTELAPKYKSPMQIKRISTQRQADALNKANRRRQILPEHLGREDTVRVYAAYDSDDPVGWVSSIPTGGANWVSNLYVSRAYRGQGVGRGLMSAMLRDDHAHRVEWSVLLASGDGARLYPHVGYERIGTLQLFVPGDEWRASV